MEDIIDEFLAFAKSWVHAWSVDGRRAGRIRFEGRLGVRAPEVDLGKTRDPEGL